MWPGYLLKRFHEHALRAAERADGVKPTLADAVVNGSPRDIQEVRGLIDGDASPKAGVPSLPGQSECAIERVLHALLYGRASATEVRECSKYVTTYQGVS